MTDRFDRSYARAQRAYDAMEAPEEEPADRDADVMREAMSIRRADDRAAFIRAYYGPFADEDDITF